ncbi:hypothetical protein GEV43_03845 [Actinomadura sp. J1-007]|uniref:hypothetical protein n=1 Tax=Actinomadura sp. J1-007 TaxID=2661913 RepID=UPI00132665E9|nr:hypothetical protein [Actinomadura sp. J1-007]MWK33259.1 hypothetical protein [Actinomadura sp. J1-007]
MKFSWFPSVVTCLLIGSALAGCGSHDPERPVATPSSPSPSTPSPQGNAISAATLRAALIRNFRGAVLDDGDVQFGKPIDSGPLAELDHSSTMELPGIVPEKCKDTAREIDATRTPHAPAAAITLRKSDRETATQLLVSLPASEINAALARRVQNTCRNFTVPGGGVMRFEDFQPPSIGLGAHGLRTTLKPPPATPTHPPAAARSPSAQPAAKP